MEPRSSSVASGDRSSLLIGNTDSAYAVEGAPTRRSRFSVAAKTRLSLLGAYRKTGATASSVSVEKAEVFFMNTRPHVWKLIPNDTDEEIDIKVDSDSDTERQVPATTISRQLSNIHRVGELATFDEVEQKSPSNHGHFKEPLCFVITAVFCFVPKFIACTLCWHLPRWLCFECSKGAAPTLEGVQAIPQDEATAYSRGVLRPMPFGVFEFGGGDPKGALERLKSRVFGNQNALDVFGTAVGVYGRELVYVSSFLALCALLEIPAIVQNAWEQPMDTPPILVGTSWGLGRQALSMFSHGTCDLVICTLLLIMVFLSLREENKAYKEVDKQLKTMHDFTIEVLNPPTQEPDYYEAYFQQYGEVRIVTAAPNNGRLLQLQARRRYLQHRVEALKSAKESGKPNVIREGSNWFSKFVIDLITNHCKCLVPTEEKSEEELEKCEVSIKHYLKHNHKMDLVAVFVTFTTEEMATKCLNNHRRVSIMERFMNHQRSVKMFGSDQEVRDEIDRLKSTRRDTKSKEAHELSIRQAPEPMDLHWKNLGVSRGRLAKEIAATTGLLVLFMCLDCWVISLLRINAPGIMAPILSVFNVSMPKIMKFLVEGFETHESEGSFEMSFMTKLTLGRIVNFGVLLFLVTPYEERMSAAFIKQAQSLQLANCFWVPCIKTFMQLLMYRLKQLVKGATAVSQEELNKSYEGVDWMLGERYTDMLKTLFMGLFFAPLIPGSMFITTMALVIQFWVDKASMLKVWRPGRMADGRQVSFVSKFFVLAAVMSHVWMAQEVYANWPYKTSDHKVYCGLFGCYRENADWLGKKQVDLLNVYASFAIYVMGAFLVIIAAYVLCVLCDGTKEDQPSESLSGSEQSRLSGNSEHSFEAPARRATTIDDVAEKDAGHFPAYLPSAPLSFLIDPLVVADIDNLPERFLPRHVDCKGKSVNVQRSENSRSEIEIEIIGGEGGVMPIALVKHYPGSMTEHHPSPGMSPKV